MQFQNLAGGGSGSDRARNFPYGEYNFQHANPDLVLTLAQAQYWATVFKNKGMPITVPIQKALAKAGLEITTPNVILLPTTPTQAAVTVGVSTPQEQQAQTQAIAQAVAAQATPPPPPAPVATPLQTPNPAAPVVTPAPSVLTTPAPATADQTSLPTDATDIVPSSNNNMLLLLGAGALALLLFAKKGKR